MHLTAHARPISIEPGIQNAWAIDRANRSGRRFIESELIMASPHKPGKPGNNPATTIIIIVVLASYADKAWVTAILGAAVLYGLIVDWLARK